MMFKLFTDNELKTAIRQLEDSLISGEATVSYAGGGMVQMSMPGELRQTLQALYDELGTRTGYKHLRRTGARSIRIRMKD
jgi:hypothetical protein